MGDGCSNFEDETKWVADWRASLREGGGYPRGPVADLQLGRVVRLTAGHDDPHYPFLYNTSPLPDHAWLHGRMTPDEWRQLITAIDLAAVDALLPALREFNHADSRNITISSKQWEEIERVSPYWEARGIKISKRWVDDVPRIFVQPIPIPPPLHAAAAMEPPGAQAWIQPQPRDTVAALPGSTAESAEGQPPGGPASSAEGVAPLPPRFCPHCGTAVALLVDADTAKFCSQCGAKWK